VRKHLSANSRRCNDLPGLCQYHRRVPARGRGARCVLRAAV